MELKETFVSRQEIFHGRIVDLRVDTVRLPNGHLTTREVIDHPGGVAVVAIDENDNVLTVKQYRYAFQTVLEEIPAGKLERGEDPAAAARRELSEETGASCETLTPLGEILASPGGFTEVLHLYMATGLTFGSQHPDEDEFINFERVPFDALLDRCLSGEGIGITADFLKMIKAKGVSPKVVGVEVINDEVLSKGVAEAAKLNFETTQSVLKAVWPEIAAE